MEVGGGPWAMVCYDGCNRMAVPLAAGRREGGLWYSF